MSISRGILALSFAAQALSYRPCPLLGRSWEPSTYLADATILQQAFETLQATVQNATETGLTDYGTWYPTNNSFSIGIFDVSTPGPLFSMQHASQSLQEAEQGVKEITQDTIFRIGSVSKLVTVYLFLIELGPRYFDRSVTEFIPELKKASTDCGPQHDAVDCVDWNKITLGALASHMAGVPRDYSTFTEVLSPLNAGPELAVSFGLPPLPKSANPPCGLGAVGCSAGAYLEGFTAEFPAFPPFTTPLYSNGGLDIFAIAMERITKRNMSDMLDVDLFRKLGMSRSSYGEAKRLKDAAIPSGAEQFFGADLGANNPAGGMFSTVADLSRMGQSILSSELLELAVTRQWMKPVSFTSSMNSAVGMPWEIFRVDDLADYVFDLYSKSGDLGTYSSYIALSPDYHVGFAILVAGNDTTNTAEQLANTIAASVFPAVARATKEDADAKYAGKYTSADDSLNSSLTISTQADKPGLVVAGWISNGTSIAVPLSQVLGVSSGLDIRLYPTGLVTKISPSRRRIGYRAIFDVTASKADGGVFDPICSSWVSGVGTYGNVDLSDFVFDVENGKVLSVEPRAFRKVLDKQG